MDISRSRFPLELVKIIQLIADSHFVALDLEFSGIPGRRKDRRKPTLQEVYEDVKEAAEQYQVLQVGLTVVHEDLLTGEHRMISAGGCPLSLAACVFTHPEVDILPLGSIPVESFPLQYCAAI